MTSSIIITTFNRAGHLRRCLPTLLNQKVKADEVIIVDDGSQDQTEGIVKGLQNDYPEQNIRYIYNHRPEYLSSCLPKNIGIKQSKGEVLIFTEPEILHIGETIKAHLDWQERQDNLFISAGTIYYVFSTALKKLTMQEFKHPELITEKEGIKEWLEGYMPEAQDIAVLRTVYATYCASIKKKYVMQIHGFEEKLERWGFDDINLQSRLSMAGAECKADPKIECVHLIHGYTGCFEWFDISKKLHEQYSKEPIANQGREWGQIIERP